MITYGYNECLIITGDFTKISKITNINTDTNTVTVSNYQDLSENNNYLLPIREIPDTTGDRYIGFLSKGAHVEGRNNMAAGDSAHAEGYETQAIGEQSHTEGFSTIAEGIYQHVQGTYNIPDSTSLDIVGNGNIVDGVRSNAYTLDRNGNGWYSGDVYVGSTSGTNKDDGSVKLAKITDIITSYNDLTDKPTIPTKTGDLTNNGDGTTGSKYITNTDLSAGLDSKQDKITGGATTIVSDNLPANKALISNANGKVAVSDTTSAELGYLSGARSNLQSQIDAITTEGGQPNVIEVVQENGTPLEVSNKTVNVIVPTNLVNGIETGSLRTIGSTEESDTYKLGQYAFAEGRNSMASGLNSHAEGKDTKAKAWNSHAEGRETEAQAWNSHAEGRGTIANRESQHVQGNYNISDVTSLDIVGNGTDDNNRSNAYTLDASGNAWYSGDVYVGSTSGTNKDVGSVKLAKITEIPTKVSELENDEGYLKTIPIATTTILGGIKVGNNLNITTDGTLNAEAGGVSSYNDLTDKPILNTTNTNSLATNSNETINGTIDLHKVAKTGDYNDLNNKLNIVNGSAYNSLRTNGADEEDENYELGRYAFAEGEKTKASGDGAHAEGYITKASGYYSHAEGDNTTASGNYSHAEGDSTTASGTAAHTEGTETVASGNASHAEGQNTKAMGNYTHAEGENTICYGSGSHAEGTYTEANSNSQHAQGKYNIVDYDDQYAHIVGNGTADDARSNAHTLDWDGNSWYAGSLYVGGTSQTDTNAKKIATEEYVDNKIVTDYDKLTNRPTLNTNVSTSQPVSESELITGEMVLHKISKTGDYNDLLNKPTIPTKTSDLTNDSGFVDNSVSNLTNYYNKTETYTQSEVNNLLDNKANKREVMVAGVNRKSWTISGSWSNVSLLPLQYNNYSGNGKLIYTTNGIKIGKGVSKILISATINGINYSSFGGDIYFDVQRKRGTTVAGLAEVYNTNFSTSFHTMNITPFISEVQENELIYLTFGSGSGGTGEVLGAWLCVEVLE